MSRHNVFSFYVEACEQIVCYTAVFSVVTQRSSPQTAAEIRTTSFPLCLWSNEQTNHVYGTLQYVSRRALGSAHGSQFSTNQSIVAEFERALCLQATKRLVCRKVCCKRLTKTSFTRAKKIGTARQIFGSVLTILRHGTPNF